MAYEQLTDYIDEEHLGESIMDESSENLDARIAAKLNNLQTASQQDLLTGLWNQAYITEQVDEHIAGGRGQGVFFLINIDNFTAVNESYGHIMGDACLVEFAGVLKNSFRDRDVVARLSGDEFAVFLAGNLTNKDIGNIANKLMRVAAEGFASMNIGRNITTSIGISNTPANGLDFLSLYRKAGEALRHVKRTGKNDFYIAESNGSNGRDTNTMADMQMLKKLITERHKPQGALKVEYEGFKHIYQFLARYSERTETDIEMILFTISGQNGYAVDPVTLSDAMFELENIIKLSLRIGDVATKYSSCQYLVMLIGAQNKDSDGVAKRITGNYNSYAEKYGVHIKYDMQDVSLGAGDQVAD